jgi:hypothetical protein
MYEHCSVVDKVAFALNPAEISCPFTIKGCTLSLSLLTLEVKK